MAREKRAIPLDGRTWTRYSISIWSDIQKTAAEKALAHPAAFPQALVQRLIAIFGRREAGLVLDPFAGSGATLCAAAACGRPAIGLEINPAFVTLARRRLNILGEKAAQVRILHADSRRLATLVSPGTVDLCITSPPYWDILHRRRSADKKACRPYSDLPDDLGNTADYHQFLAALENICRQVWHVLAGESYFICIVMDIRKGAQFYPFHIHVTDVAQQAGFTLDDIIIWDRRSEYNCLRPLGYPYVFRVNKVHEYILIFQKKGNACATAGRNAIQEDNGT